MKIKMLKNHFDITFGKVYDAEIDNDTIKFQDDALYIRRWNYPDDLAYIEVEGEVANEPEQLTLRDRFAMAANPPDGLGARDRAEYRYLEAYAMMEARKK